MSHQDYFSFIFDSFFDRTSERIETTRKKNDIFRDKSFFGILTEFKISFPASIMFEIGKRELKVIVRKKTENILQMTFEPARIPSVRLPHGDVQVKLSPPFGTVADERIAPARPRLIGTIDVRGNFQEIDEVRRDFFKELAAYILNL